MFDTYLSTSKPAYLNRFWQSRFYKKKILIFKFLKMYTVGIKDNNRF